MSARFLLVSAISFGLSGLLPSSAWASEEGGLSSRSPRSPFDQPVGIGAYTQGWAGAYGGVGLGGRGTWEFVQHRVGLDLFAEAMLVDWPGGGERHDIPIGFNLYAPIAIGSRVRLRALAGMCAVFSFIESGQAGAPSSNDVLFGLHAGVGLELRMVGPFMAFVDAQGVYYLGHDRTAASWSGSVSGALSSAAVFQPTAGVELRFGR